VLLVDLDLRRPRVHKFFDQSNEFGFTNLGRKAKAREQAIVAIDAVPGLSVLVSGPVPSNPAELLETKATREALESFSKDYDLVIVDSPPILGLSDSLIISALVDSTIIVANSGVVKKRDLRAAVDFLHRVQAPLIGAVVNGVEISKAYGYAYGRYGDGYGSYYSSYYDALPSEPVASEAPTSEAPAADGSLSDPIASDVLTSERKPTEES